VSVSGNTAVVGAPWAYVDGAQGAAYVFNRDQGGADAWGQVAKLTAADGGIDNFAISVSVDADTALVGAYLAGYDQEGAAYVFYRNQGGPDAWGQVAKVTAADGGEQYRFGQSVSLSGDTAVAGAPYGNSGGAWGQGAVYVFDRNQGGADAWGQAAKLTAADGAPYDGFGVSVSVSGTGVFAGAYGADVSGQVDQGAAYVFYRDLGGANAWGQFAKLTASDGAASDNFGQVVSVGGDRALVGVQHADVGGNADQGAAYVYSLPTHPTADFSGSPTGGPAPLTVAFTNTSTGDYDTFLWDLGDGSTSSEANPSHIYSNPGAYTVSLTVTGLAGSDTLTREGYITAYTPVSANFTGAPRVGVAPLGVAFTNTSTGDYTTSFWRFGDGTTSAQKNPGHRYASIGNYTVILTVKGPGGTNTLTRTDYIGVYAGMAHVDVINLTYSGQYVVTAVVRILDQNNQPVSAATVAAQWTLPNGSLQYRQNQTNANGVIGFQVQSPMMGPYKLCVLNVTKTDWYYDRMRNVETCDQKTVP
jgi:PKD repeat protein